MISAKGLVANHHVILTRCHKPWSWSIDWYSWSPPYLISFALKFPFSFARWESLQDRFILLACWYDFRFWWSFFLHFFLFSHAFLFWICFSASRRSCSLCACLRPLSFLRCQICRYIVACNRFWASHANFLTTEAKYVCAYTTDNVLCFEDLL